MEFRLSDEDREVLPEVLGGSGRVFEEGPGGTADPVAREPGTREGWFKPPESEAPTAGTTG